MSTTFPPASDIRDYLLRRMSETGRARFEEAYFTDDGLLDRIEAEEDTLVSDYVLGKLAEGDRRLFEDSLLGTPYYQERVETTSRLKLQIAQNRAFRRPAAPGASAAADNRLFPGRTGTVVGFAFLTILLVASLASALSLKSDLARERAKTARSPALPVSTSSAAVVPLAQTVAFDTSPFAGPSFVRLARPLGTPLLLVFPRRLVAEGARSWDVVLSDGKKIIWESGPQNPRPADDGDLALRIPAGVPPVGRAGVLLRVAADPPRPDRFLGGLETADRP
jgi:hypothetical protein